MGYPARGVGGPVHPEPLHPDIRRMPRFRPAISGLSWSNFRPFLANAGGRSCRLPTESGACEAGARVLRGYEEGAVFHLQPAAGKPARSPSRPRRRLSFKYDIPVAARLLQPSPVMATRRQLQRRPAFPWPTVLNRQHRVEEENETPTGPGRTVVEASRASSAGDSRNGLPTRMAMTFSWPDHTSPTTIHFPECS